MDKKKRNILVLPIEIKIREFFPKLYLAYYVATRSNFDVYIGGQRFLTKKYNPKSCLWFDKFTYTTSRKKAQFHIHNDVVMQDEEGPISYHNQGAIYSRYTYDQKKYVKHFIFSGQRDLKRIKYLNLKRKKIFGLLKLDLLKKKKTVFDNEVNIIKKKYKNFLFIPGHSSGYRSIAQANYLYKEQKKFSKVLKNEENMKLNYLKLINLVIKIAKQNPKLIIIFRKHPNETKENLKKLFKNKPKNIKLIYKYTVTPWILACDHYLHSGCQTSLEAIAIKKKIVTYMPVKLYPNINFKLTKPFFADEEKCLNFFKDLKKNKKKFSISKQTKMIAENLNSNKYYVNNFINFLKKEYPYQMKSELQKRDDIHQNFLIKNFMKLGSIIKSFLVKNDIYLNFIPKSYYISKESKEQKFNSISAREIKNYLNYMIKLDTKKPKLSLRKTSESAYLIMSKKKYET